MAAITPARYISDDLFLDFRAWVMLSASRAFAAAVKNPDTIAKLISRDEVGEISSAGFPGLPLGVWLERKEDDGAIFKNAGYLEHPNIAMPWPESRREFQEEYPIMCKAFWNSNRMKAFNGGGQ